MTQKITGWTEAGIDMHPGSMSASLTIDANKRPHSLPCVVVIGDERVFTESEVKAILEDMRGWLNPDDGEEGNAWATRAKIHGIDLDPA